MTLVVLREEVEMPGKDEFDPQVAEQIRVMKLVGVGAVPAPGGERQPHYVVEGWREEVPAGQKQRSACDKRKWVLSETRTPLRSGKSLPEIPFVFHGLRHAVLEV